MSKKAGKRLIVSGSKAQMIIGNGSPILAEKQPPNEPCKCGSGLKAKKCCGTKTKYMHSRSIKKGARERPQNQT